MKDFKLKTAVAFFIYRRPETTILSFREIAKAKPEKLLLIADGPRASQENWEVLATRNIVRSIDWDCEVFRHYSEENLGCKSRVSTGLEWVFSQVDEAIIIEDDVVPAQSFFRYCQEMLEYHRLNEDIFTVSGCNIGFTSPTGNSSYSYSNFMNMWGWATWKRAFEKIDFSMQFWPSYKNSNEFKRSLGNDSSWIAFWEHVFERVYQGEIDTWDYQWILSQLFNKAYSIVPNTNMIENIGCGPGATHTKATDFVAGNLARGETSFPIVHPGKIEVNREYDKYIRSAWCGLSEDLLQRKLKGLLQILSLRKH